LLVVLIIAGCGTFLGYKIYTVRDGSKMVRLFGSWLPAAKAGKHTISYKDFLDTRDTLNTFIKSSAGKAGGAPQAMTVEIERQALNRLIREQLTKDLAEERKISVTDTEVLNSFETMVAMNSSTVPNVAQFLQENYKWTEAEFQTHVVRPAILEERVAATFSTSTQEQWAMLESYMQDRATKPDVKIYLKFDK
jgi:hypothetical protein